MTSLEPTPLEFPFKATPDFGSVTRIADGVLWLRMPMPFALDHINLWLLEEEHQWTVVDSGLATDKIVELWEQVFSKYLAGKPIKRVICTHMHPDHVGLAGWLCSRDQGELWMSRSEYTYCRTLLADTNREAPEDAIRFYQAAGFSEQQLGHYRAHFGSFGKLVRGMPNSFHRVRDGEKLLIGKHQWQVIVGHGHSPEHVCLRCDALGLFISGDQLLPHISSNISVWPLEPDSNPLEEWLHSCHRLDKLLDDEMLILPSHGMPFRKARVRLRSLIDEHEQDLCNLVEFCSQPRRVVDAFTLLFKAKITQSNQVMACGESRAHFNCLLARQQLISTTDENGVLWFQRPGE